MSHLFPVRYRPAPTPAAGDAVFPADLLWANSGARLATGIDAELVDNDMRGHAVADDGVSYGIDQLGLADQAAGDGLGNDPEAQTILRRHLLTELRGLYQLHHR